jgi:hypothetical protein
MSRVFYYSLNSVSFEAFVIILRDPRLLSPPTQILWQKQQNIIIEHRLPMRTFETKRIPERQKILFETGASQTMESLHLDKDGAGVEAWDVAEWIDGQWTWKDIFWFQVLGILTVNLVKDIKWGADWNGKNLWFDERFRDYGHFERRMG